jgi:hypothetical protein
VRSEDITSLFTDKPAQMPVMPVSNSRTGQVTAFDPLTGASTIVVDGQEMTDLAIDVVGAVPLQVGDFVQIDTSTPRWYVKGKISEPGSGVVPTWPADIEQASADAAAAQAAADALQDDIDAAAAAVAVVEASLATLNGTTLPALEAALDAAVADVAAATASLATLTGTTLPALAADLDAAEADIATAQGDITTAQADITAAQADVTAVQGDVTTLTSTTIPALQAEVDDILPIGTTDITDDAITTPKIATNAITAGKIQADAVTAVKILAGAVTTAKLDAGAVTAAKITAGTITATELATGAITTVKLAAGAVTANELAAGSVTALKIAANTITAAEIAADAITASELAANAVTAGKIAAGTIVAADISAGAITTAKIAADAVTANEIAAGTITATEIATGAVTAAKLTADAIDGKTITGALLRTAASGQRVEIDVNYENEIRFYTGNPAETEPGRVESSTGGDLWVYGPSLSGANGAGLRLHPSSGQQTAEVFGDRFLFNNETVVTAESPAVLYEKTLGPNGTQINCMRFGNATGTTTAVTSQLVVTHGLGGAPTSVVIGTQTQDRIARIQGSNSTTFTLEVRNSNTGALIPSSAIAVYWLAVR